MPTFQASSLLVVAIASLLLPGSLSGWEPSAELDQREMERVVRPLLREHCIRCHGPTKQEAELRLDRLGWAIEPAAADVQKWQRVFEQLRLKQMPPPSEPAIESSAFSVAVAVLRAALRGAGADVVQGDALAYPVRGNLVDHHQLFHQAPRGVAATPARLWRLSPFTYREFVDALTGGMLIEQGGPAVLAKKNPLVATPFGLTDDAGFRDYAFRYQVSGSETQQLALNSRIVLQAVLTKRNRYTPPRELAKIAGGTEPPSAADLEEAVRYWFRVVIYREPSAEELARYCRNLQSGVERMGNYEGLIHGLVPVLLHPDAIFRSEMGSGAPDPQGRKRLSPLETAIAISYALTDKRPTTDLLAAAREGRLVARDDVSREVQRMLADSRIEKPRILRFFREYFDYDRAITVFKDPVDVKAAGILGRYDPDRLVADTDQLVLHVVKQDRDVLRQLLTTQLTFVDYPGLGNWLKFAGRREQAATAKGEQPPTHPFGSKPGQNQLYKHYSFDPEQWSSAMPLIMPPGQRAGILTQPAWLIAHSANTENHAIHRGKWIRERLLGGAIPDVPITVEAKLPEEPQATLRERMRVTRVDYCAKCHRLMDPLGLPFESYDHFGQFRKQELARPVDSTGEIVASGDSRLDGKVNNALELIHKLADSPHVEQVFVRHAFRYWLGRNETLEDAATLQAAHRAYVENHGSLRALILTLLTSDSFFYRTATADSATQPQEQP